MIQRVKRPSKKPAERLETFVREQCKFAPGFDYKQVPKVTRDFGDFKPVDVGTVTCESGYLVFAEALQFLDYYNQQFAWFRKVFEAEGHTVNPEDYEGLDSAWRHKKYEELAKETRDNGKVIQASDFVFFRNATEVFMTSQPVVQSKNSILTDVSDSETPQFPKGVDYQGVVDLRTGQMGIADPFIHPLDKFSFDVDEFRKRIEEKPSDYPLSVGQRVREVIDFLTHEGTERFTVLAVPKGTYECRITRDENGKYQWASLQLPQSLIS